MFSNTFFWYRLHMTTSRLTQKDIEIANRIRRLRKKNELTQELRYSVPTVVLLALIVAIASDYCRPLPLQEKGLTIEIPQPFNPLCYVASFKPEAPEFQSINTTTSNSLNLSTVTYSGTANSGPSTSTTTTL